MVAVGAYMVVGTMGEQVVVVGTTDVLMVVGSTMGMLGGLGTMGGGLVVVGGILGWQLAFGICLKCQELHAEVMQLLLLCFKGFFKT